MIRNVRVSVKPAHDGMYRVNLTSHEERVSIIILLRYIKEVDAWAVESYEVDHHHRSMVRADLFSQMLALFGYLVVKRPFRVYNPKAFDLPVSTVEFKYDPLDPGRFGQGGWVESTHLQIKLVLAKSGKEITLISRGTRGLRRSIEIGYVESFSGVRVQLVKDVPHLEGA